MLLERLRDRLLDHLTQSRLIQASAQNADVRHHARDGFEAVIRTAAGASRLAAFVTEGDLPAVPAGCARFGSSSPAAVACRADPQVTVALHESLGLAAVRAARQDQPPGAVRLQRPDQQLNLRRSLRTPGGQETGITLQCAGEPPESGIGAFRPKRARIAPGSS